MVHLHIVSRGGRGLTVYIDNVGVYNKIDDERGGSRTYP